MEKEYLQNFYTYFKPAFAIPGLEDDFVPQGITYIDEDTFLLCGYVYEENEASRIYVVQNDKIRQIALYEEADKPYTGHTGGIASYDNLVWLANDGNEKNNKIWCLSLDEILDPNCTKLYLKHAFTSEVRASSCSVYDGYLWIGEYEDNMNYLTKASHHITKNNPALVVAYKIDIQSEIGIENDIPQKALSVRNRLQGIAFDENGDIYLSSSCKLDNSSLDVYDSIQTRNNDTTISISNHEVPLWILDDTNKQYSIVMPPMSEGIAFKENTLYILFESASSKYKYKFGSLFHSEYVFAY